MRIRAASRPPLLAPVRRTCGSACRARASGSSSATQRAASAYEAALARFAEMGATLVEIDLEPFYETARLLYEGPWVAERYLTAKPLIEKDPSALHPVILQIVGGGGATVGGGCLQGLLSRAAS